MVSVLEISNSERRVHVSVFLKYKIYMLRNTRKRLYAVCWQWHMVDLCIRTGILLHAYKTNAYCRIFGRIEKVFFDLCIRTGIFLHAYKTNAYCRIFGRIEKVFFDLCIRTGILLHAYKTNAYCRIFGRIEKVVIRLGLHCSDMTHFEARFLLWASSMSCNGRKRTFGHITKTCLYNFDPLKPHFYIVKQRLQGHTLFFSYFRSKT